MSFPIIFVSIHVTVIHSQTIPFLLRFYHILLSACKSSPIHISNWRQGTRPTSSTLTCGKSLQQKCVQMIFAKIVPICLHVHSQARLPTPVNFVHQVGSFTSMKRRASPVPICCTKFTGAMAEHVRSISVHRRRWLTQWMLLTCLACRARFSSFTGSLDDDFNIFSKSWRIEFQHTELIEDWGRRWSNWLRFVSRSLSNTDWISGRWLLGC